MSDTSQLKETIRGAARALGFDQVGFAPAETPVHAREYLAWIERGHHGEMAYMAREDAVRRRLDPRQALPGCRTIIVTSLLYGPEPLRRMSRTDASPPAPPSPTRSPSSPLRRPPVIARYAVGRDYHDVFEERLDELSAAITAVAPEAHIKRYVDYGPVLERDHAQRAGLGWIGKNTMLIHPALGSYLMLGELLTDLDLEPDEPFVDDRCGTCTRCLDACPTDAIREDRTVDARLCISYLTIELDGAIPTELRAAIGGRVFGCDICQEVCPWNRGAPTPARSPFELAPGQAVAPELMIDWAEELLGLSAEAFRARYRGTAFVRPGRDGLLRNLAVGLGNTGGQAARPVLQRLAADGSALVREHARWSLARLDTADRDADT